MTIPKLRIGDVAQINPRPRRVPQLDEMVSFAGMTDLSAERGCITQSALRTFAEVCKGYTPFHAQDILVAKITPCFENCKIGEASIPTDIGYGSTEFHVIRPLPARLDRRYLLHFLRQERILKTGERRMTGSAGQKRVPVAFLEALEIPLPPLEEQRRIAAILDKADRLASLQARASIIGKEWAGSVFSECFTDSESYIEISIEEALESQILLLHKDGNHGSSYPRSEDFGADGVPFISAKSIVDSGAILDSLVARLSEEKAQSLRIGWLESGDVLLAHNASVGKTALYEGQYQRALIGTSLTAFRPNLNHLNSHYLLHYLSSPSFQSSLAADMSQTTRNQVPITAQRRLALRIPPLSKQEEFAARVMSADRLSGKRRQSFRCIDALRKSLFGALLSP